MTAFALIRHLDPQVERVWEVLGNPAASPGPGVAVHVERPGAADHTGLVRTVKVGRIVSREEITGVKPPHEIRYRMIEGAPVRDYSATVTLDESAGGGTRVCWEVSFRPRLPGTGPLIAFLTKRTLNRVLDAVEQRIRAAT